MLTFDEFAAHGRDFELSGEGKVKLHEAGSVQADLYLKFKFSDEYRGKSDAARHSVGPATSSLRPSR